VYIKIGVLLEGEKNTIYFSEGVRLGIWFSDKNVVSSDWFLTLKHFSPSFISFFLLYLFDIQVFGPGGAGAGDKKAASDGFPSTV
jgi:hypothetical protein